MTPRHVIDEVKREVRFALGATPLLQRLAQQEAETLRRAEAARSRRHAVEARRQQMAAALRELASEIREKRLAKERALADAQARAYAALDAERARARAAEAEAAAKRAEEEQRGHAKTVAFEEGDPLDVALAGLKTIGVDSDAIEALSASCGIAKGRATAWKLFASPPPR